MNVAPFVIDIGTNFIKHELSGSEEPNLLRSEVGFEKYTRISSSSSVNNNNSDQQQKRILGKQIDTLRGVSRIEKPIDHGSILSQENQSLVESLLRHCIVDSAKISPSEHPVLLTEPVQTSDAQRKALAEFLFEDLRCSTVMFGVQPVLSLHAFGKTTGLVFEHGAGVTQSCAVYDGYTIRESCARRDFGGNDVTSALKGFLRESLSPDEFSNCFSSSNNNNNGEWEVLQDMKHKLGEVVHQNLSTRDKNSTSTNLFQLPDGTELKVPQVATSDAVSNLLFSSSSSSSSKTVPPLQEFFIRETVRNCDITLRSKLLENIFLSGGGTLMKNFGERFASEVAQLVPATSKVRVHAAKGRENAAWVGGSLLTQMSSTVLQFGVTRSQYLEEGKDVLLKKKVIG